MNKYIKILLLILLIVFPAITYIIAKRGENYRVEIIDSLIDKGTLDFKAFNPLADYPNQLSESVHVAHVRFEADEAKDNFMQNLGKEIGRPEVLEISNWSLPNIPLKAGTNLVTKSFEITDKSKVLSFFKIDNEIKTDNFVVLFDTKRHVVAYSDLSNEKEKDIFVKQFLHLLPPLKNQKFRKNRKK